VDGGRKCRPPHARRDDHAGAVLDATVKDALFWTIVTAVVALRYVDVTRLHGRTADGEPATPRHVLRHAVGLIALSAVLWTIVQSVQFLA
jgi:hypothetical protein